MLKSNMSTLSAPPRRQWLDAPPVPLAVAALTGVIFAFVGYRTLVSGYPYEDAYILFRYARHLAAGDGIVFNVGGPHAEGATDFLWMVTLAGLNRFGIDVAIAAVMLNAAGAALLAYLLCRTLQGSGGGVAKMLAYVLVIPVVVLSGAALAAYGGFSAMLYSALVVLLLHVVVRGGPRARLSIPFLALTLALFRPDGVVLGATFVVGGAFAAKRSAEGESALRSYLFASALSGLLGIVYFAWRWHYFGLLLPLPLYVKAHPNLSEKAAPFPGWLQRVFTTFPGLGPNVEWLLGSGVLLMCGLALGGAALVLRLDRVEWRAHA
ncbi:MAG: hypothetical protein JWM82_2355, partial [Myxococcales bacterium]|nr:hypothetical protein [Myxococcales bacterium]